MNILKSSQEVVEPENVRETIRVHDARNLMLKFNQDDLTIKDLKHKQKLKDEYMRKS